jgi:hypothetical protein
MSSTAPDKQTGGTIGRFNTAPSDFDPARDLPEGFLDFVLPLHHELTPRQQVSGGANRRCDYSSMMVTTGSYAANWERKQKWFR